LKKSVKPQPLTRSEKRAAALDGWVKQHVAESREADTAKKSRLKELRLAREALQKDSAAASELVDCALKAEVHGPPLQADMSRTKKRDEP
jgi:hypothetical protein